MAWLNSSKPKINTKKKDHNDIPDNLWIGCKKCGKLLHHKELNKNNKVCVHCGFHMKMSPVDRFKAMFDAGKYKVIPHIATKDDPLNFTDLKSYKDRLKTYRTKTGEQDVVQSAVGKIDGVNSVISVMNFDFMGGSMGVAVGENIVNAMKQAVKLKTPFIIFTSSGGARMQEGVLSLMQMVRTTVGVNMLEDAKLPYIVIHTNPTTGGVSASFAMLGDIHIAEPNAVIAFAGRRVIEETNREKLPKNFQTAEFLQEKGMVDMVVERKYLKDKVANLLKVLSGKNQKCETVCKIK